MRADLLPRLAATAALVFAFACTETQKPEPRSQPKGTQPDMQRLFVGPVFLTGDPALPEAAAIAVDNKGRVQTVFKNKPPAGEYDVVELEGALAVPGLHDAHAHLLGLGQAAEQVDLLGARSPAEINERVRAFADAHPDASAIRGRGWDQSLFADKQFPTAKDLEGATDKPVYLRRVDGHAALVNAVVLKAAGVDKRTKDPDGGRILRDKKGEPTGVFVDNAMSLVSSVLPEPTDKDLERWLLGGTRAAADAGLVAVHDMGLPLDVVPVLARLDREGKLPIRVFGYLDGSNPKAAETAQKHGKGERLEIRGVKLFADGAMGSRGAALLEDYSDEKGHKGLLLTEPKILEERVRQVHERGKQVAIHAIGDRGNRTALEAIAHVQGDDTSRRHRLEHAQLIHKDDFDGIKKLGVIASMQPTHATSDMRWAEARVGPDRVKGAYAWRTMLDQDIPLAFGSDAPVESIKPTWGLYAAVTRQDHEGSPDGGWMPAQKLSLDEAVRAFSAGAAYAVEREGELGALKPGYRFDLSVFDKDPREDPKKWLAATATATIIEGELREAGSGS